MSKIDFTGRVAIVTGAGAGLGRNHAIELAKRGAKVVVNDLGGARDGVGSSESAANKVAEEIKALGGEAVPNYDNVATYQGGENIVKTAIDAYGKVDILINNAGILRDKSFLKMEEENWDAVIGVHLRGAYCVTKPAFANMRENSYGRIVMTSSIAGILGNFGQSNYGAAKMGLVGLMNVLKLEGAKYNIKVNVLAPNAGTRLTEDVLPPEVFEQFRVEYVTPPVLYLCSEQCQDSGIIVHNVKNYYNRFAVVMGPGVTVPEGPEGVPTPEDVMANWEKVLSLENAKHYNDVNDLFGQMGDMMLVKP
jgi:NAD(P)-dependent dehydrogenase (short-subunit alcohol dehydrogenase family)